ncbi:MAG TPA: 1,2-phenylacetyl-CoA epoxidase subunit PaaC [Flavobacteriaceae bacterium]|nr:1,2-phenylacetyl-CoA epoxidase subunit PaaC [Flavobacteriaceae bacterium]
MSDTNRIKTTYAVENDKVSFIYGIADNSLILAQRVSELTGHGPSLETDIALTNIALDLFGQVRMYYQYAADILGDGKTEDDLAFFRTEREFKNVLLVEQPNEDFAYVIARQFLFDHFHFLLLEKMQKSEDGTLASIARKSIKEVAYHRDFSSNWIKRLGDGTEESHQRMQTAINDLWEFTDELFHKTTADEKMIAEGIAVDVEKLRENYHEKVLKILDKATIEVPETKYFQKGGKEGVHSEHMGRLLTDMQYMQRTYPGMKW